MSDELFIECKICNMQFLSLWKLSFHLKEHNISKEDYYKKYIANDENCDKCKECGKRTRFYGIGIGFKPFCSAKCSQNNIETKNKKEKTCLEHYGVTNNLKSEIIKKQIKETNIKKYGYENPGQVPEIKEKIKNVFINKYGTESYMETNEFKEKSKNTCKKLYNNTVFTNREKYKETCLKKIWCFNNISTR